MTTKWSGEAVTANNRVFVFIRDVNITEEVEGILQEVRIKAEDAQPHQKEDEEEGGQVSILSSYAARWGKRNLGHHLFLLSKITFSLLFYLNAMSSSVEVCNLVNSRRANSSDSVQFTQCVSCAHLTSVRMLTISTLWHTGAFPSSQSPPPHPMSPSPSYELQGLKIPKINIS